MSLPRSSKPIRVALIDDSKLVWRAIEKLLAPAPDIELVGTAPDPYQGRDLILQERPDVVLLDIEMPRMDGLTFLRKIMKHHPLPVIIVSSIAPRAGSIAMRALAAGAFDVICKPGSQSLGNLGPRLVAAVRAAAGSRRVAPVPTPTASAAVTLPARPKRSLIVIGASTGGTETTRTILQSFPANAPGTVIVQHITPEFASAYAAQLDQECAMRVREARDGDLVETGVALVAPGDQHLVVERAGVRGLVVRTRSGPKVHHQRPSIDVLFESVARVCPTRAVGVILTGMGKDGAKGLLAMRRAGSKTIAQDEETAIVYGMPRVAAELGAAEQICPLDDIAAQTFRACA